MSLKGINWRQFDLLRLPTYLCASCRSVQRYHPRLCLLKWYVPSASGGVEKTQRYGEGSLAVHFLYACHVAQQCPASLRAPLGWRNKPQLILHHQYVFAHTFDLISGGGRSQSSLGSYSTSHYWGLWFFHIKTILHIHGYLKGGFKKKKINLSLIFESFKL